jgi:hypothetical protein
MMKAQKSIPMAIIMVAFAVCIATVNSRNFVLGPTFLGWSDAEAYCLSSGMRFASMHNAEEAVAAQAVCTAGDPEGYGCWIGLIQYEVNVWSWRDGSPTDYGFDSNSDPTGEFPWGDGQPTNMPAESCGLLANGWSDGYCSSAERFPLCADEYTPPAEDESLQLSVENIEPVSNNNVGSIDITDEMQIDFSFTVRSTTENGYIVKVGDSMPAVVVLSSEIYLAFNPMYTAIYTDVPLVDGETYAVCVCLTQSSLSVTIDGNSVYQSGVRSHDLSTADVYVTPDVNQVGTKPADVFINYLRIYDACGAAQGGNPMVVHEEPTFSSPIPADTYYSPWSMHDITVGLLATSNVIFLLVIACMCVKSRLKKVDVKDLTSAYEVTGAVDEPLNSDI